MGVIFAFLVVLGMTYFTYLDSQKRGVKNQAIWVALNFFIPVIGFLVYLFKRPKQIVNLQINKIPYGYRSKTKWKMAVATLAYLFIIGFTAIAATSTPTDTPSRVASTNKVSVTNQDVNKNTDSKPQSDSTTQPLNQDSSVVTTQVNSGGLLKVSYIDVGQADSILVQIPNGKNLLIDTGNREDYATISNYLRNQGVNKIDTLLLTHMHEDHIGSASQIVKNFDIGQVIMPKQSATTQVFRDLLSSISGKKLNPVEAKAGLTLDLGSEVNAQLLAPNNSSYEDANDYSAVLRLVFGKNVFLFTGDAQAQSESEMLNHGYNLKADVLKVGHHGSHTSTSAAFLAKVQPQFAVISVGKGNTYGHPAADTISKLANSGAKVYRTDESGTIVVESNGETITFSTSSSSQPRGPDTNTSSNNTSSSSPTTQPIPVPIPSSEPSTQTGSLSVSASMSNPTTSQNSTETLHAVVTSNGKPVSGANVTITCNYSSTDSTYSGVTNSSGVSDISFKVSRAKLNFTVRVDVTVSYNGQTATTSTSFTPK